MNLFLQLSKPNVDIPEDSEVLGKFENWLHRILQMSWDDLLHEAVKLGGKLVAAVLIYIVGRWLIRKADGLLNRIFEKRGLDPSLNSFIRSILRIVVWVFLVMIIVGVLGIRTTSFLAILASAGFAVGMALSGTLQNIGDDAPAYFHAEAFGLFAEVLHELRTHDAFRVSGKVLDFGRRGELSAGQHSLVEDGAEVRASRVYCGRISCGAAAHDEAFYSFYAHNCRFICLAKIGNLPLINPKRL